MPSFGGPKKIEMLAEQQLHFRGLIDWHPHYDVWIVVVMLAVGYWLANTQVRPRVSPGAASPTRRQQWQRYGGLGLMVLVSGWPVHDIGEQLFMVHMVEHMVLALAVPPLLLMAIPRWLADVTLGHRIVVRVLRPLSRPLAAFVIFNTVYIVIHWPDAVESMLTSEVGHFLIHLVVFFSACLVWMPVLSPTRAIPKATRPMQMLYLFGLSILPTIPASFLTFSPGVIYPIYGDAALAWGLTPVADQTIAGVIMKLGGGLLLWGVIAVIWFRWTKEERDTERVDLSIPST